MAFLSFSGKRPSNLGINNGALAPIPDSPNAVSTESENPNQKFEPIPLGTLTSSEMIQRIESIVESLPRTTIVEKTDNYLYVEFRSLVFRFVDDVEFYVDENNDCVRFRSASRVGHSDLGANRSRMAKIVELLDQ